MRFTLVALASMSLAGCVEDRPRFQNDLAGYQPQQLKAATQRAETPAHISTVAFKELGDSKRFAQVARLIRETWDEACEPASLQLGGYQGNGSSVWTVHCKGTLQIRDYVISIPELAKDNSRVLKCHQVTARLNSCSIVGPAETASARTNSTL